MPSKQHDDFLVALGVPKDVFDQRDPDREDGETALEEPEEIAQDEEEDFVEPEESVDDENAEADEPDEIVQDQDPEFVEPDEDEEDDSDGDEDSDASEDSDDEEDAEDSDDDEDSGGGALGLGLNVLNDLADIVPGGPKKNTGGLDAPTGMTLTMDEPIGVVELLSSSETGGEGREFELAFKSSAKDALFVTAAATGSRIAGAKIKTPSRTTTLKDVIITSVRSDGSITNVTLVSGSPPKPKPQVISTLTLDEPMGVFDLISSAQTDLAGREFALTIKSSAKDALLLTAVATGKRIASAKITSPTRNVTLRDVFVTTMISRGSTTDIALISGPPPKPKPNRPVSSTLTMDEPIGVVPLLSFAASDGTGNSFTVTMRTSEKDALLVEPVATGRSIKKAILATPEGTVIFKDVSISALSSDGSITTMSFIASSRASADP
jgi:hypothetical protein